MNLYTFHPGIAFYWKSTYRVVASNAADALNLVKPDVKNDPHVCASDKEAWETTEDLDWLPSSYEVKVLEPLKVEKDR